MKSPGNKFVFQMLKTGSNFIVRPAELLNNKLPRKKTFFLKIFFILRSATKQRVSPLIILNNVAIEKGVDIEQENSNFGDSEPSL